MVLEKTIRSHDVGKVVIDTFGENTISLVVANGTMILTRISAEKNVSDLAMASENSLAKDWLSPEEDEAWKFL
jgi:hypothetical protein